MPVPGEKEKNRFHIKAPTEDTPEACPAVEAKPRPPMEGGTPVDRHQGKRTFPFEEREYPATD